jgi:hypothetical protein
MFTILHEWSRSLKLFSVKQIGTFFYFFLFNFIRAIKIFVRNFWWIFVADAIFFVYFGDLLRLPKYVQTAEQPIVSSAGLFLHLVNSILFFILTTAFLLSIRKPIKVQNSLYFKAGFLRYIQLQLIFSVILLFVTSLILSTGIEVLPHLHWSLSTVLGLVELLIVFYWLDSDFRLKEILFSLEKTLNIVLYNIPFFILAFIFLWGLKFGLGLIFSFFGIEWTSTQILGKMQPEQLGALSSGAFTTLHALKLLIIKYISFFIDYFFIALIFAFYCLKRDEIYTLSIFETKKNDEEFD